MKELWTKIREALISALPITAIVYIMALTPLFDFYQAELITFTVGAVMLILGIGLFNMGADLAMTPMGTHVGSGLSKQRKLGLLLAVCFVLGMLITIAGVRRCRPGTENRTRKLRRINKSTAHWSGAFLL